MTLHRLLWSLTALVLLILLTPRLVSDDKKAEKGTIKLNLESRYEQEKEFGNRVSMDYQVYSGALVIRRKQDDTYLFSGGLSSPCLSFGSLTLRGPLQELIKPGALTASTAKYSDPPAVSLDRSWTASSRKAAAVGVPGTVQFSIVESVESKGELPELALEAEASPLPWLRCAAVCSYAEVSGNMDEEWIQEEGIPVQGALLLGGVRIAINGDRAGFSGFAGTSLHRMLPAGTYLRGSCRYDSPWLSTRLAVSRLDRDYRSPRHPVSPYHLASALDMLVLPVFPVKGFFRGSARLKHSPLYGPDPADLRLKSEGGMAWTFKTFSGELSRDLLVKRDGGEYLWEENLGGNIRFTLPLFSGSCTMRPYARASYLLGYNTLDTTSVGISLRKLPLDVSFSCGFSRQREAGEAPEGGVISADGELGLIFKDWGARAGFTVEGDAYRLSLQGGRSFRF
ncbi:hypothetical protein [Marispirochaeta sp.]|uniref:hypothetical protein n=1 Tax=Marispirochaeta sp. TaxID=2038653 RepID=UPI0029C6F27D|nr:hypothetical protein [Marispirochaeta sp.]